MGPMDRGDAHTGFSQSPAAPGLLEPLAPVRSILEERAVIRARAHRAAERSAGLRRDCAALNRQCQSLWMELTHVREALGSRGVIEQAKGVLMQRLELSADAAWEHLVGISQQACLEPRLVAADIVRSVGRTDPAG